MFYGPRCSTFDCILASFEHECDDLLADLPAFYHAETHSISNDFSPKKDERADSWYPLRIR